MTPVGIKPTISAGVRPQTYVLDRTATGTGQTKFYQTITDENLKKITKCRQSQVSVLNVT